MLILDKYMYGSPLNEKRAKPRLQLKKRLPFIIWMLNDCLLRLFPKRYVADTFGVAQMHLLYLNLKENKHVPQK